MSTSHPGRIAVLIGVIALLAAPSAWPSQSKSAPGAQTVDPAVEAYVTFVRGKRLTTDPIERPFVVAALDRLAGAVEGLALARDVSDDKIFKAAHQIRRDIRRLSVPSDTSALTKERRDVFVRLAELVIDLSDELGPEKGAPKWLLDNLRRSADGLDFDYPLRSQPNNVESFLRLSAEALEAMARR